MSCARLPRCLAHGGVREFGCGVTSRHARRCCRNRGGLLRKQKACGKCDALRTTDNRPYGDAARPLIASCLLLSVLETIERNESDVRVEYSEQSVSLVSGLGWLALSCRQAISKASIGILSAFRFRRCGSIRIPQSQFC